MQHLTNKEIYARLDDVFDKVVAWVESSSEDDLNSVRYQDRWTAAGHVFHLVKTTKAVSSGFKVPRILLRMKFGTIKREEKSYEALKNELETLISQEKLIAKRELSPAEGRKFGKEEIIKRFRDEQRDFKEAFDRWKEYHLSKNVLPHPVVGNLTIREMAYFNILHTWHHLGILERDYH